MASPGDHRISEIRSTPELEEGQHYEHQTSTGHAQKLNIKIRRGSTASHKWMYQAALRGDWQLAEELLQEDSNLSLARITEDGDTALHVAATTKQTIFIRKLVKRMSIEDLKLKNIFGYTAFDIAAGSGIVENAAAMLEKNQYLARSSIPILAAARFGHTDMVSYLYPFVRMRPEYLSTEDWFELLMLTIPQKMYGVALKILTSNEALATMKTASGRTALRILAEHDISDIGSTSQEALLRSLIRMIDVIPFKLSWLKRICEQALMRKHGWLLARKLWGVILTLDQEDEYDRLANDVLHDAAKVGNVELITMLTRNDPDLVLKSDSKRRTIFHIAAEYGECV